MTMRATAKGKAATAYRTISEVAEELGVQQHVLRFWETRFAQIRPVKRGGGRRYYRPEDIAVLHRIRTLLYDEGYTIKGALSVIKTERRAQAPQHPIPATGAGRAEAGPTGTGDLFAAPPAVSETSAPPPPTPAESEDARPAMIPREPLMALLHELRWLRAGINLKR